MKKLSNGFQGMAITLLLFCITIVIGHFMGLQTPSPFAKLVMSVAVLAGFIIGFTHKDKGE